MFTNVENIQKRNKKILKAYKLGYSQYKIVQELRFSQAYINKILKKERVTVIT